MIDYRECPVLTAAGEERLIAWHNITLKNDQGEIAAFLSSGEDITERKRAEEEIQQLNRTLEQRVKERTAELAAINKEMEAFSYSVSHDLRAPLRGIDGFGGILEEEYADMLDSEGKRYIQRIRAATGRMARLIDDMLGLSRVARSQMQMRRISLSGIVKTAAAELRKSEPERKVSFDIQDAVTVKGDSHLLRILMENLLSNAWKFTAHTDKAKIEFGVKEERDREIFFVRDNGAGFDMAYSGKLFDAFQRLHSESEFPGTGIGLATAQRIVRRHGGDIWAEGKVGEGAAFYFTLKSEVEK
jgi:light-regulated signal transduction histidine kinase (bacteriophytochrome)